MNDARLSIALLLVLATGIFVHRDRGGSVGLPAASASERAANANDAAAVPQVAAITSVPIDLGPWHGANAGSLEDASLAAVGADRILNRTYVSGGSTPVGVYVAAYDRQRPSVSIHSPLHCLPGTGWSVLSDDTRQVANVDGTPGAVRRLVAVRDNARIVILYWYAIHGRMVASDALSRAYLLADSLRLGRNDAALVRLVIPVAPGAGAEDDGEASDRQSEAHGLAFMRVLLPHVSGRL